MAIAESQFLELKKGVEKSYYEKRNITQSSNLSLKYLVYRLKRPMLKLKYKRYQRANPSHPWLTPDGIAVLQSLLTKDMSGLEYGSGGSTIFFSGLLKHITSVEHNQEWFDQITDMLHHQGLENISLNFIAPDVPKPMPRLNSEDDVLLSAEEYPVKDSCYQSYVDFIGSFPDNSFDFILIDGRARVSCSIKAFSKLKPGGFFVLDNSERKRYHRIHEALKTWPSIYTTTGLTDTVIWRKP